MRILIEYLWSRCPLLRLESPSARNALRVLEPVVILMVVCQLATLLPDVFPCTQFQCTAPLNNATRDSDAKVHFKGFFAENLF